MISFITTFKPFKGLARVHQINALRSWTKFVKDAEIIVVGKCDGFEEVIKEFHPNLKYIKEVKTSYSGAPFLDDMLNKALCQAINELICVINGDIIILSDFIKTVCRLYNYLNDFLLTCRRIDLEVNQVLDFDNDRTELYLKNTARKIYNYLQDKRVLPYDLFVFTRDFLKNTQIPPFVYGRGIFVRWYIYNAHCKHIPIIDATPVLTAIHQLHLYEHIKDSLVQEIIQKTSDSWLGIASGKEFEWNVNVAGCAAYFSEGDFTHILTERGLLELNSPQRVLRRFIKTPLLAPYSKISLPIIKFVLPNKTIRAIVKRILKERKLFY